MPRSHSRKIPSSSFESEDAYSYRAIRKPPATTIQGWYCTCSSSAREVGMCSHVTVLLWHLGVEGATVRPSDHPLCAQR